jgi:hypothetical protein
MGVNIPFGKWGEKKMTMTIRRVLAGMSVALTGTVVSLIAAAQQMPQTTKETIKGGPKITTEKLRGTVLQAEGNTLVVQMSTGEIKEFVVPESRKFIIDGKELSVHDLKVGTKLRATVTTTKTPITERTTTIGSGTVWFVSGNNVIITLPDGENRNYKVEDHFQFNISGEKATVHDLRKGMTISAQKIVEEPRSELKTDTAVTGEAPRTPISKNY